jgi:hypothetical protein
VQGEGWNTGWKATVDGKSLGRPIALDGGMNAWWLTPSDQARTVKLRWTPQRTMWIALGISALAVLACLVLACLPLPRLSPRRRRALAITELAPAFGPDGRDPTLDPTIEEPSHPTPVAIAVWSAAVLLVGVLVAGPVWGLLAGVVTAAGIWLQRRWIAAATGILLATACGLYVIVHEQRSKFGAGFGWVGEFGKVQRPALAAVVLLVSNIVVADWARRGQPRWAEEDRPDP